jgi:hypothetical protein
LEAGVQRRDFSGARPPEGLRAIMKVRRPASM